MTEQPPAALAQWNPLVLAEAEKFNLDPFILSGLIWVESSGKPDSYRYEPAFTWFFDRVKGPLHRSDLTVEGNRRLALDILGETEFAFQSSSHGLSQCMGSVAREMGYNFSPEGFYDPATNIHYGAKYLSVCFRRAGGIVEKALLRYNGGGISEYPDKVLRRADILRQL